MFILKVQRLEGAPDAPGNPAYLLRPVGIRIRLLVAFSRREILLAWAAILIVAAIFVATVYQSEYWHWHHSGALVTCGLAIYLIVKRSILTIDVSSLPVGTPFPIVDPFDLRSPSKCSESYLGRATRHFKWRVPFRFHMAVRNTYPDVTDRLLSYSDDKGRERTISDDYRSAKVVPFLMEDNTMVVFRKAVDAGKYIAKDYQAKTDLLPLIRLAIGRMLYPRSKAKTTCREWNEEINTPAKESLHLQFAFRLYTLPVYYWLLLVSLVFLNLDVSQEQQDKSALAFLISCLSLWIAFTVWQHSRIATRWRNWLGLYSKRPLGRLPVFLYCPQNDPQYRWEELDDFDFIDHLSEYIVDSEKFINITIGLFAILLLTIMQVVG